MSRWQNRRWACNVICQLYTVPDPESRCKCYLYARTGVSTVPGQIFTLLVPQPTTALLIDSSRWRYSPGWALASSTMCLQVSRFLVLSFHSFKPIFLRSMDTSSSHLIFGLPLRLVAYSFPYNIVFGITVSCILSMWPSHRILWQLMNLSMFSPLIMASNSLFRRILHNSFSFTGPYIFRKIFLSNTANALPID